MPLSEHTVRCQNASACPRVRRRSDKIMGKRRVLVSRHQQATSRLSNSPFSVKSWWMKNQEAPLPLFSWSSHLQSRVDFPMVHRPSLDKTPVAFAGDAIIIAEKPSAEKPFASLIFRAPAQRTAAGQRCLRAVRSGVSEPPRQAV